MSHNLKPNTEYKIVTIQIASLASSDNDDICDGIGEMVRSAVRANDGIVDDWRFVSINKYPVKTTSEFAEEGELFD